MCSDYPWPKVKGICFGADYNPEQWSREVWQDDIRLMKEAGVNLVSVGIFSWALLEPSPGKYDFTWLDEVIELLTSNGISIDLATPTASAPAWFFRNHPEARVVTAQGTALEFGSRGMPSPASPAYRQAIAGIAGQLARRYGKHPGVVMWHIHNEYGEPAPMDHSAAAQPAFQAWLKERYQTIENLNEAWGTKFWGQHYYGWEEIRTPSASGTAVNPTQQLDFMRFIDRQMQECFLIEKAAIRKYSDLPVTTNFMAPGALAADLWQWSQLVDVVANDHYLAAEVPEPHIGLSMSADATRSLAHDRPWFLMEHSTSAVNWQPRNIAKRPGEMERNSLTHFGRGADAILFFQWRASRFGAEKFHSAMVPHAGENSKVFRSVKQLGADLERLADAKGTLVRPKVAIVWDFDSLRAQGLEFRPSCDVVGQQQINRYYQALWRDNVTVDFVRPGADLSQYSLVVLASSYMMSADEARTLTKFVSDGGTLLVSYFTAAVDRNDCVHAGGLGAPLADVTGVRVEEYLPLAADGDVQVRWATDGENAEPQRGIWWAEDLQISTAEVVASFDDVRGSLPGSAAITRNKLGQGTCWYVATQLEESGLEKLLTQVYADAGVKANRCGLEVVTREGENGTFTTVVNHSDKDHNIEIPGYDVLGNAEEDPSGGVTSRVVPAGKTCVFYND